MANDELFTKEQIVGAGAFLWRQFMDAKTIGETLRLLLIERGVFTDAEYQEAYQRAADLLREDLSTKLTEAGDLQLLELLRKYDGMSH